MKNFLKAAMFCLSLSLISICFAACKKSENSALSAIPVNNAQTSEIPISAPGADAAEPVVAVAPDNSVYVAWVEHAAEKQADVFIRHFDAAQQPLGEAVRVNSEIGRATAWRGDPPTVKVGGDGSVYVGWTARVAASSANDLYLSVSPDNGKTFAAPVRVNDDTVPAAHGMHSLEIDKNGGVFVAWLDERYLKNGAPPQTTLPANDAKSDAGAAKHRHGEPNREVYFAVSSNGGKTFSANKRIAENVCPCCKTALLSAPDNKLYIAWRQVLDGDFRHIAISSTSDGGNSFAPAAIVSDDRWQINGCPVSGAAMTADAENNLKIVWYSAGAAGALGIYSAESKDGGRTFSPRTLASDKAASGTPVMIEDEKGKCRLVFSANDKNVYSFVAQNAAADFGALGQIKNAELPSAVVSNDKTVVAFIRNENGKRRIFLTTQN